MYSSKRSFINAKTVAIFLFLCVTYKPLFSQYFDNGQDPAHIKWRTFHSEHFEFIYPDFFESEAKKIAVIADSLFPVIKKEMNFSSSRKARKLPLILHARSSYSNAFVAWAPRRMEWYTCTPQDTYSQPWFEQLAIHESRHELQLQVLNQSSTGFLTSLLGEHFIGVTIALFVPQWFMEGDAVWAETALSKTGRGKDGDFTALNKAQLLEKGIFSYDKAAFGSYKDFIPNQYNLGYFLIAYTNEQIDPNYWQKILKKVSKLESLSPFNASGNRDQLYSDAMTYWRDTWAQDTVLKERQAQTLTPHPDTYTSYSSPFYTSDSTFMALKSSFTSTPHLVEVNAINKKEKKRKSIGGVYENFLDYKNGKLVYAESSTNKRWDAITYSNLIVYDINKNTRKRLSSKKNFFSPAFSDKGNQIVLVEMDSVSQFYWIIVDSETGKQLNKSKKSSPFISHPIWGNTENELFYIEMDTRGKCIQKIDLSTEEVSTILPFTYANIRNLQLLDSFLFFISDQNGSSQVFAFDLNSGELYQITESKYGVGTFSLSADKKEVLFSNYTSNGYEIQNQFLEYARKSNYESNDFTSDVPLSEPIIQDSLFSKPYHKWKHLFNFHSWTPAGVPTITSSLDMINPGVTLLSQNLLSTSFLNLGYMYNQSERANRLFLNYTYKGFYPIITTTFMFQQRNVMSQGILHSWNEARPRIQMQIPFYFSRSSHYYGISLYGNYEFASDVTNQYEDAHYSGADISLTHSLRRAYKQLQPQWRQSISISYRYKLSGKDNEWIAAGNGYFYFPGFASTHSFNLYGGVQIRKGSNLLVMNLVNIARGFHFFDPGEKLLSGQFNYAFPLFYPDTGIPGVFYCKRLLTNLFFDGMLNLEENKYTYSTGIELSGNWNLLRIDYPITMGIRCAFLPQLKKVSWGLIFSIDV